MTVIYVKGDRSETQIRFFRGEGYPTNTFEIETFLTSIPTEDGVGKEVVMRLQTNIKNGQTF